MHTCSILNPYYNKTRNGLPLKFSHFLNLNSQNKFLSGFASQFILILNLIRCMYAMSRLCMFLKPNIWLCALKHGDGMPAWVALSVDVCGCTCELCYVFCTYIATNETVTAATSCRAAVVACFVRVSCRCLAWNWVWLVSQRICRLEDRIFAYLITIAKKITSSRRALLSLNFWFCDITLHHVTQKCRTGVHHTSLLTQLQHKISDWFTHTHAKLYTHCMYTQSQSQTLAPLSIGEITFISFNDFTRCVVITVIPLRASQTTKSWHTRDIMCGIWWRHQFNNILSFDRISWVFNYCFYRMTPSWS